MNYQKRHCCEMGYIVANNIFILLYDGLQNFEEIEHLGVSLVEDKTIYYKSVENVYLSMSISSLFTSVLGIYIYILGS